MHFDDAESKGFSSTAKRFTKPLNDLPGYYAAALAAERLERSFLNCSISKNGYGSGFASKYRRFKEPLNSNDPSPNQYKPTPANTKPPITSAFQLKKNGSMLHKYDQSALVRTRVGWKSTPGPSEYQIPGQPHQLSESSVFKSKTIRLKTPRKESPLETIEEPTVKKYGPPTSSFIASERLEKKHKTPGPTHYNPTIKIEKIIPVKYKLGNICNRPQKPLFPLSDQTSVPGSGMTPIAFPTPGRYDIAKGDGVVFGRRPEIGFGRGRRFASIGGELVGPGFYHPVGSGKRSFQLNMDQKWI